MSDEREGFGITCDCAAPSCKVCQGMCIRLATAVAESRRAGVRYLLCDGCAIDAIRSGVFTARPMRQERVA